MVVNGHIKRLDARNMNRGQASCGVALPPWPEALYSLAAMNQEKLLFVPVGDNEARAFGMIARERMCRLPRMRASSAPRSRLRGGPR